jgi:hypothetical protein
MKNDAAREEAAPFSSPQWALGGGKPHRRYDRPEGGGSGRSSHIRHKAPNKKGGGAREEERTAADASGPREEVKAFACLDPKVRRRCGRPSGGKINRVHQTYREVSVRWFVPETCDGFRSGAAVPGRRSIPQRSQDFREEVEAPQENYLP